MKYFAAIIFFLAITNNSNAQVYVGANTALDLPLNNYEVVDYGSGAEIMFGYL
jgi:hypothetical protein